MHTVLQMTVMGIGENWLSMMVGMYNRSSKYSAGWVMMESTMEQVRTDRRTSPVVSHRLHRHGFHWHWLHGHCLHGHGFHRHWLHRHLHLLLHALHVVHGWFHHIHAAVHGHGWMWPVRWLSHWQLVAVLIARASKGNHHMTGGEDRGGQAADQHCHRDHPSVGEDGHQANWLLGSAGPVLKIIMR